MVMRLIEEALVWARKKACVYLHIPHVEVWLTLDFYDEQGNLTKHRKQLAKSWVRNAYNLFFHALSSYPLVQSGYGAGILSMKNTGGTNQAHQVTINTSMTAPAQSTLYGITLGRGASSYAFDDHALDTVIAAGNGASQLFCPIGDTMTHAYSAGTKTYTTTHSRVFNNNSEADIALTNIGIVSYVQTTTTFPAQVFYALFSKDVLSPSETIYDKAQVRVTYQISLTFPA